MSESKENKKKRSLAGLDGIGRAMLRDFERLKIRTVEQLARANPERMYERLAELDGCAHDICCLDVFRCAVAQARNPKLPSAQRNWWYWSRQRKKLETAKGKMRKGKI